MEAISLSKFLIKREGVFGQLYRSIRFYDKEITIDNIMGDYRVCECSPYNEKLDNGKLKKGAGEVVREWLFNSKKDADDFLDKGMI
jgi:hypothetical protein